MPGLRHGFLDRADSGVGRWEPVLARLGTPLPLVVPRQVHGVRVAEVTVGVTPEADAMVTSRPGMLVGVVTADCVPVLLVDRARHVAAAVHAGWRGMAAGVIEAALDALEKRFGTKPPTVEAVVGPAIGGCCYEVGPEVGEAFRATTGSATRAAWTTERGRDHVDLRTATRLLLEAAGVPHVDVLGPCTSCDARYHSYRRDGAGVGRQLSFVGWTLRP